MLPDSLSKEIKYLVYFLIAFHIIIVVLYIWALKKSWNTSASAQLQNELKREVAFKKTN